MSIWYLPYKLLYMVCMNILKFRITSVHHSITERYSLAKKKYVPSIYQYFGNIQGEGICKSFSPTETFLLVQFRLNIF